MILSTRNYLKLFVIGGVIGVVFSLIVSPSSQSKADYSFSFVEEVNRFGEEDFANYQQDGSIKTANINYNESINQQSIDLNTKQKVPVVELDEAGEKRILSSFEIKVKSGDTLDKILQKQGFDRSESYQAIKTFSKVFNPKSLKVGQTIKISKATNSKTDAISLEAFTIEPRIGQRFSVRKNESEEFEPFEEKDKLTTEVYAAEGSIDSNLLSAALDQNVPISVAHQAINTFSHTVDFRRDLRKGDQFTIMYEMKKTPDDKNVGSGDLVYASLILRGHELSIYRYTDASGFTDFYDSKGRSLKKSLSRRPVKNARISSPFGMRRHPITRRRVMHWGTDFAAPRGTPIAASGDGVVTQRKRNGSYGNYVEIRHNNEFSTAYAHLNGFVRTVKVGTRVKQGQTIGYVGNTGRSTGPHLHFEVRRGGRRINPMTVKAPAGRVLEGKDLENFNVARKGIDSKYASLTTDIKTALKD